MAPPASRIYDVCEDLLAAVVAHHGGSLPARQYVSAGPPAWDTELVAVWCESTGGSDGDAQAEANSALSRAAAHTMRTGVFVVTIARCTAAVPDGLVIPSVALEEDAARTLYEDGQRVLNALVAAQRAEELPGCNGIAFQRWSTIGPSGGMVAGELRVRVGLATGL